MGFFLKKLWAQSFTYTSLMADLRQDILEILASGTYLNVLSVIHSTCTTAPQSTKNSIEVQIISTSVYLCTYLLTSFLFE